MSKKGSLVLEEALLLPPEERAEVVDRLLASLDSPQPGRIAEMWGQEAEDRIEAFERGKIKAVPAHDVFSAVKNRKP